MKNKKGFTLVELLAVIIILGLIMIIIIPNVMNVVENSRIKSFENSTQGLMRTLDIAQKEYSLEEGLKEIVVNYNNGSETVNIPGLTLNHNGKKPQSGEILITEEGKIEFALYDGTYCATKSTSSDDIKITKTSQEDCYSIKTFVKSFGGTDDDGFNSVVAVSDGYIAVGGSYSTDGDLEGLNIGDGDAIIVKYDTSGNVLWNKNYGGGYDEYFTSVAAVSDGYIAVGGSYSTESDFDAIIVKYDTEGNVLWNKNYGGSSYDEFYSIITVSDGYIAVGGSYSTDGDLEELNIDDGDAIIVKYDTSGNVLWNKNYGGSSYEKFYSVTTVSDGYIAVGSSYSIESEFDAIIVKYDIEGNVLWNKNYGGGYDEYFTSVTTVSDGYIAVGYSDSTNGDLAGQNKGDVDAIIVKYDTSGNILWKKNYGGSYWEGFFGVATASDGYIAVGYSDSTNGDLAGLNKGSMDTIIVKYDTEGNILWNNNYGGSYREGFWNIVIDNNSIITVGSRESVDCHFSTLSSDYGSAFIMKLDENGNANLSCTIDPSLPSLSNPS
ncbi:MAG: prepilin-type N-terminal cleavage/methylation domain-containing protein [Bacilli bacterium]|nr:prepilin-type N-terminal cleavage/methylation domain-containing protein [Bacilli bacterium]